MNATNATIDAAEGAQTAETNSESRQSTRPTVLSWLLQLVAAAILCQTLFFKFTAAEESVYIFRTLGLEPWGRIGSGVAELIAVVLCSFRGRWFWARRWPRV